MKNILKFISEETVKMRNFDARNVVFVLQIIRIAAAVIRIHCKHSQRIESAYN